MLQDGLPVAQALFGVDQFLAQVSKVPATQVVIWDKSDQVSARSMINRREG